MKGKLTWLVFGEQKGIQGLLFQNMPYNRLPSWLRDIIEGF